MPNGTIDVEGAARELTDGAGYVLFERFFDDDVVAEARTLLWRLAEEEAGVAAVGDAESVLPMRAPVETQKRVWNLIEKSAVFRAMAEEPRMLAILEPILGHDFVLTAIQGSVNLPGAPQQDPHVDYPFWDLYDPTRFPRGFNASFHMQVETVVMLDDFTSENGATALVPGSHKRCIWPDADEFERSHIQACGPAGSLIMFIAPTWHAGRENRSQGPRSALLSGYHCKFIRQLEDFRRCVSPATLAQCSERLRYLLGIDQPYPALPESNRRPVPVSRKDRTMEGALPPYAVEVETRR